MKNLSITDYIKGRKRIGVFNDFRFEDLSEKTFKGANFARINLKGANLKKAHFIECSFSSADLSDSDLRGATFEKCDLRSCKMFGSIRSQTTKFIQCEGAALFSRVQTTNKTANFEKAMKRVQRTKTPHRNPQEPLQKDNSRKATANPLDPIQKLAKHFKNKKK